MAEYKVYAIEFDSRNATTDEMFLRDTLHQAAVVSYYIWAIVSPETTIVVDTGYGEDTAKARGRQRKRCPIDGLKKIGIDPEKVEHVILTHFHWDHMDNHHLFPRARFYAQEKEMAFWNSPYASIPIFREVIEPENIKAMVDMNLNQRLCQISGSKELFPGVTVHLAAGHTAGMQMVEVQTAKGILVIASDAAKSYRNLSENIPDPYLTNAVDIMDTYAKIRYLAGNESMVMPGHDPDALNRFERICENIVTI